jgi:hypothetical protein
MDLTMYKNLPQDIRPLGTNNLNQLVHHQLGSQSFDVVAHVQANLPWLNELHNKLGIISSLAAHGQTLDVLAQHTQTLWAISESMPALKELYCNLDLITKGVPKLNSIDKRLTEQNAMLNSLLGHVSKEDIESLDDRYAELDGKLAEHEILLETMDEIKTGLTTINQVLVHLQVTELVNRAVKSEKTADIEAAKKLLDTSIKLGNDESYNQSILEDLND